MGKTCACGLATITWYFSKMGCGHCKSHEWWHNRSKRLWPLDVTRLLCEKKHGYEASFTMVCIRYTLRMPWYSTRHQYIIPTNQPIQQLCSIKCLRCWLLNLYIWVGSGNETIKSLAILLQAHCLGSNSASAYLLTAGIPSASIFLKRMYHYYCLWWRPF